MWCSNQGRISMDRFFFTLLTELSILTQLIGIGRDCGMAIMVCATIDFVEVKEPAKFSLKKLTLLKVIERFQHSELRREKDWNTQSSCDADRCKHSRSGLCRGLEEDAFVDANWRRNSEKIVPDGNSAYCRHWNWYFKLFIRLLIALKFSMKAVLKLIFYFFMKYFT